MKLIFSFLIVTFTDSIVLCQRDFNVVYQEDPQFITNIEMLYEDDDYYYSVGYAEPGSLVGVQVIQHDKVTGQKLQIAYIEKPNQWLFTAGRTPVYKINNQLQFGVCGRFIYKLGYNINDHTIETLDSIKVNVPGGPYISDMIISGDTTHYLVTMTQDSAENQVVVVRSVKGEPPHFVYLPQYPVYAYAGIRFVLLSNGNFLIFGGRYNKQNWQDDQAVVLEVNPLGKIIHEILTPSADYAFNTDDIQVLDNGQEVMWLTTSDIYPKFFHTVYKYNIAERKITWKYELRDRIDRHATGGGEIIKGHNTNEYLYCTTVDGLGATNDSIFNMGRVVKITGDGKKVWHKDYIHTAGHLTFHHFYTMISTLDSSYLIGGYKHDEGINSWLVKIDENGNIVHIDTTSDATEPIRDIPEITIYPNPAHDYIIINQGEQTDMTYSIYDMNGKQVMVQKLDRAHLNIVWDISDLANGAYVLSISQKGKQWVSRPLIKQ